MYWAGGGWRGQDRGLTCIVRADAGGFRRASFARRDVPSTRSGSRAGGGYSALEWGVIFFPERRKVLDVRPPLCQAFRRWVRRVSPEA